MNTVLNSSHQPNHAPPSEANFTANHYLECVTYMKSLFDISVRGCHTSINIIVYKAIAIQWNFRDKGTVIVDLSTKDTGQGLTIKFCFPTHVALIHFEPLKGQPFHKGQNSRN